MKMKKLKLALFVIVITIFIPFNSRVFAQSNGEENLKKTDIDLDDFLVSKHNYKKIPITQSASGHLHVKVLLNNVEGYFVLDTGAGATILETQRKDAFKIKVEEAQNTGVGAGGKQQMQKTNNNTIQLGELTLSEFQFYVMNLDHVNNAFKKMGLKEVDGVLGADILKMKKAVIDYSNLVLYLID